MALLKKTAKIMIQGTTSDAGKTFIVAALCRIFKKKNWNVAPFKSQNMSLNSFVTEDGKEIARSQVLQALAAKIEPKYYMNPILLKPKGNGESQIVLNGRPFIDYHVRDYYSNVIPKLKESVKESLIKISENHKLVIIEGAGSPAEINLHDREIANMYIAKLIDAPVILVADIERGGVFASIYGTIKLLPKRERKLIKGFIINRFRGDVSILEPGIVKLEKILGIPCLGVIPYINNLYLPAEDSMDLKNSYNPSNNIFNEKLSSQIIIKIIRLPFISNFTDYEALQWESNVKIIYIDKIRDIYPADAIIIPGTKNTIHDLKWLHDKKFSIEIQKMVKKGIPCIGICGGYEMLCRKIIDHNIEANKKIKNTNTNTDIDTNTNTDIDTNTNTDIDTNTNTDIDTNTNTDINTKFNEYSGLNLIPADCVFDSYEKLTRQDSAIVISPENLKNLKIKGYEIHMGKIIVDMNKIDNKNWSFFAKIKNTNKEQYDGITNNSGTIIGTFIHGLWDMDVFRKNFINHLINLKKTRIKNNSNDYHAPSNVFLKERDLKLSKAKELNGSSNEFSNKISNEYNIQLKYKDKIEKSIEKIASVIESSVNINMIEEIIINSINN